MGEEANKQNPSERDICSKYIMRIIAAAVRELEEQLYAA